MDDLIEFCVEQIALDGEQGTIIPRLWEFVKQFQKKIGGDEVDIEGELDETFQNILWRHLLCHDELTLRAGDDIVDATGKKTKKPTGTSQRLADVRDVNWFIQTYGDSLHLLASEDTQWISITGFPKIGNPVPNLHFKLLSCVSQGREEGVTQADAAKQTKQDPRSFPSRTKLLQELGLITKTKIIANGNVTYRLVHSRFVSETQHSGEEASASAPQLTITNGGTTEEAALLSDSQDYGFVRDETLYHQIRKRIAEAAQWDKRTLIRKLNGEYYKDPIENFLERNPALIKNMPRARQNNERKPQQPKQEPEPVAEREEKVKEPKVKPPPKPKAKPKPKPKKENQPLASPPPPPPPIPLPVLPVPVPAPPPQTEGHKETATSKRKSTGEPDEASLPKRQKLETHKPTKEERASEAFLNTNIMSRADEIDTVLLSLIKERQGILELVPRLDNLYKAHAQIHFPQAQARPDGKTLTARLSLLEEAGQMRRIMVTAIRENGMRMYKSLLVLPEVDLENNPVLNDLKEELKRDAVGVRPVLIDVAPDQEDSEPSIQITVETASINKQRPPKRTKPSTKPTTSIPTTEAPPIPPKTTEQEVELPKRAAGDTVQVDDDDSDHDDTKGIPHKRIRASFTRKEHRKVLQAVSLIKKYVGYRHVPWAMLKTLLPDRKATSIKRRWEFIEVNDREQITTFMAVFERKYAEALERREVKPIVAAHDFDVKKWVDWYDNNGFEAEEGKPLLSRSSSVTISLPKNLDDLLNLYDVEEIDVPTSWQTEYLKHETGSSRRRQDAIYKSTYVLLKRNPLENKDTRQSDLVTSLIKSTVVTPENFYDKNKAKELLTQCGNQVVSQCLQNLLDARLITRANAEQERLVPGRQFRSTDKWHITLRSPMADQILDQAQAFRNFLAEAFKNGKEVMVSELTNDGSIYCILNLLASQQVILKAISPEIEPKTSLKLLQGRRINKEKFDFSVIISATDKFQPDVKLRPSGSVPPREEKEFQTWITVNDEPIPEVLDKMKRFLFQEIHHRPGITRDTLVLASQGILAPHECDALLSSLFDDGLIQLEAPGTGLHGAMTTVK